MKKGNYFRWAVGSYSWMIRWYSPWLMRRGRLECPLIIETTKEEKVVWDSEGKKHRYRFYPWQLFSDHEVEA